MFLLVTSCSFANYVARIMYSHYAEPPEDSTGTVSVRGKLIKDEERASGQVTKKIYVAYMKALGGVLAVVGLLLPNALRVGADIAQNSWLGIWTAQVIFKRHACVHISSANMDERFPSILIHKIFSKISVCCCGMRCVILWLHMIITGHEGAFHRVACFRIFLERTQL